MRSSGISTRRLPAVEPEPFDVARAGAAAGHPVVYFRGREELAGIGIAWRSADLGAPRPECARCMFVLPFEPNSAGSVVIPAVTVVKNDEGVGVHAVPGAEGLLESLRDPAPLDVPRGRVVAEVPTADEWAGLVRRAVEEIDVGTLSKVVLARRVDVAVTRGRPFDLLAAMGERFPNTFLYGWAEERTVFLGASPELLVEKRGTSVRSFPLAGSAPRGMGHDDDDRIAMALLTASKEGEEHRIVVDEVARFLGTVTTGMVVSDTPSVVRLSNIQHLGTEIVATARPGVSLIDLALGLHPTPAVAGTPTDAALHFIKENEPFDRGWYAGALGWMDEGGDGEAIVALRGTLFRDSIAQVYAGAGIVRDSIPAAEVAETEAKLAAILDVLTG
jgi:isochorismate synthase